MTIKYYCYKCKKNVSFRKIIWSQYCPNTHIKCGGGIHIEVK